MPFETVQRKISKEDYESLKKLSRKERDTYFRENIMNQVIWSYGFYGCGEPYEKDGNYYVPINVGK